MASCVYAKTAAATAKTRPPKEMAVPAAAPVDCSGAPALLVELPPADVGAEEELLTAPVPVGTVELTPGTMGVTREVGAMGVAVGTTTLGATDSDTPGTAEGTTTVGTTEGTSEGTTTALVAGGAWIWPSLI